MNAISAAQAQSGAGLGLVGTSCSRGQTRGESSDSTLDILFDACRRSGGLLVLTAIEQFERLIREGAQNDVIVNNRQPDGKYKNQCRLTRNGESRTCEIYTDAPIRRK